MKFFGRKQARAKKKADFGEWAKLASGRAAEKLGSSSQGLDVAEVDKRLIEYGANAVVAHKVAAWHILARQFHSPFIYLLVVAALIAFGLKEWIDGVMILMFVMINSVLGFFQEYRSEQALRVLKKYTTAHAQVIRGGESISVPVESLVPGDMVRIQPGDIVPADLRLVETEGLTLDESVLTGEAVPVLKNTEAMTLAQVPIHKASNIAFSATKVIGGQGVGVVFATGGAAYIGSIAKLTVETKKVSSFEKGMSRFSNFVLKLVGVTLMVVVVANVLIKGPDINFGELLIFAIALATAAIPEALPLVITFSLSRGAVKLAHHKVVVKRLSAIEDLGGIEILCTDKTGTITENKLRVTEIWGGDKDEAIGKAFEAISAKSHNKDAFDLAIEEAWQKDGGENKVSVIAELPFDPERKRNSVVLDRSGGRAELIVRGAVEAIAPYLKKELGKQELAWAKEQGSKGRRVIAVAAKYVKATKEYKMSLEESELVLVGLLAFADPLKKSTLGAIAKAAQLGVGVKIVTGDSPDVAGAVAQEIGLIAESNQVITGEEFFELSHSKQHKVAQEMQVFARFSPQQKHQLIDILERQAEVGFLGEGINDAPALKSANVALVVAGASDIAREAADVILLNPSLSVIIDGIEEGRGVFANTIKYVKMTLASNFGNFYAVAIASLIIDYLPMLPIQILLVNLLSDFPLIAIATDTVDSAEVARPESYNLRDFALIATALGLVSTVFDFIFFGVFYRISPAALQTNWFIGSILTELLLLYSLRTRKIFFRTKWPSWPIIGLTGAAAAATVLVPFTTIGKTLFAFAAPSSAQVITVLLITAAYFVTSEAVKLGYYKVVRE